MSMAAPWISSSRRTSPMDPASHSNAFATSADFGCWPLHVVAAVPSTENAVIGDAHALKASEPTRQSRPPSSRKLYPLNVHAAPRLASYTGSSTRLEGQCKKSSRRRGATHWRPPETWHMLVLTSLTAPLGMQDRP